MTKQRLLADPNGPRIMNINCWNEWTEGSYLEPVVSPDLFPSILGLASLPAMPDQHVDGVDLVPLLEGKAFKLAGEALYFHFPHYHHINTMGPAWVIRAGDFKLIEVFETGKKELYNLREDIGESHDLTAEKSELVAKLSPMLEQCRQATGSKMPTTSPDYTSENDWRKTSRSRTQHNSTPTNKHD